jgi:hypothetical protein
VVICLPTSGLQPRREISVSTIPVIV